MTINEWLAFKELCECIKRLSPNEFDDFITLHKSFIVRRDEDGGVVMLHNSGYYSEIFLDYNMATKKPVNICFIKKQQAIDIYYQ